MNKILIIQNVTRERPGFILCVLRELGIAFDVVDLQKGMEIPELDQYCAMIVLGGPDSVNDENEKMQKEVATVQEWLTLDRPYLGICLGLQVLIKATGGNVVDSTLKEVGFRDPHDEFFGVVLTEEGKCDPFLRNVPDQFHVFQFHGEMVELGDNMVLLGRGKHCENQIVRVGKQSYGLQCHVELTEEMLKIWLSEDNDLKSANHSQILGDFETLKAEHERVGKQIFTNFLMLTGVVDC
jgi:GMP synthase-like glutamine amidotransferase